MREISVLVFIHLTNFVFFLAFVVFTVFVSFELHVFRFHLHQCLSYFILYTLCQLTLDYLLFSAFFCVLKRVKQGANGHIQYGKYEKMANIFVIMPSLWCRLLKIRQCYSYIFHHLDLIAAGTTYMYLPVFRCGLTKSNSLSFAEHASILSRLRIAVASSS